MIASTLSNDTLEAVAESLGATPGFFQLYTPKDEALTESLIHRAEAAGFKAIVVTLDTWLLGWRPRDLNAANFPQLRGAALQNYFTDPCFLRSLEKPPEEDLSAAVMQWTQNIGNPLTWKHLPWLRSLTKLPLILEGILVIPMTPDGPSTLGSKESTVRITEDARPTVASPRSICSPACKKPVAGPRFCSTLGFDPEAMSSRL